MTTGALRLQRPGAPPPAATGLDVVPVRSGDRRERAAVAVIGLVLAVLVVKPWGAAPAGPAEDRTGQTTALPATARLAPMAARPAIAAEVFAPSLHGCLDEAGWRVCVLGSGGAQTLRSIFDPSRDPLRTDAATRDSPSVVLLTASGAGLAFYAPRTGAEAAGGAIVVSAWRVDGGARTGTIDLTALGWLRRGDRVAGNVHLALGDQLEVAPGWPAGHYVVRLQAANGAAWDEFFALIVSAPPVGAPGAARRTEQLARLVPR